MAVESIISHWDGYSFNGNNYNLYFNPSTRKYEVYFLMTILMEDVHL